MEPRKLQTSTEHGGIGQSGYTTGRTHPDPALEKETQVKNPHRTQKPEHDDEIENP